YVVLLVLFIAYLMISNVRYRSFKDVKLSRKSLLVASGFLLVFGIVATRMRPTFALVAFLAAYLAFGLIERALSCRSRRREPAPDAPHDHSHEPKPNREIP